MASVIKAGNATDGVQVTSDNTGILELKTGTGSGTTAMTLNASQNVGIGTNSPTLRLEVVGSSAPLSIFRNTTASSYTSLRLYNDQNSSSRALELDYFGSTASGGERAEISTTGAYPLAFLTNNTTRMTLDASGNLGVGATTVLSKLQIQGAGETTAPTVGGSKGASIFAIDTGNAVNSGGGIEFGGASGTTFSAIKGLLDNGNNNTRGSLAFYTRTNTTDAAMTERARITTGGEFLLGATALTSNGFFTNAGTSAALTSVSGTNVRAWAQTYSASASNNATVDAWLGLDAAGNVFGNGPMIGHFFVNVVGASGANQFSGVYSIVTTSNGTIAATLAAVSTVTRGTSPVTSVQIANNGASGAIKLTITYINNSGVVTGGSSRVTFIGQIS